MHDARVAQLNAVFMCDSQADDVVMLAKIMPRFSSDNDISISTLLARTRQVAYQTKAPLEAGAKASKVASRDIKRMLGMLLEDELGTLSTCTSNSTSHVFQKTVPSTPAEFSHVINLLAVGFGIPGKLYYGEERYQEIMEKCHPQSDVAGGVPASSMDTAISPRPSDVDSMEYDAVSPPPPPSPSKRLRIDDDNSHT